MKKNRTVTTIIPAFNVQEYLEQCIMSIIRQTYRNLEIIIIDDGSKDNTAKICDDLVLMDSRIIVIHTKNKGVSNARNLGIKLSTHEYMTFIDSDDYAENDFIENAIRCLHDTESDYVSVAFQVFNKNGMGKKIDYLSDIHECLSVDEYISRMLEYQAGAYWGANWSKIYITKIVKNNGLQFESGVSFAEDFRFNLLYIKYIKTIGVVHNIGINYRVDTYQSLSKLPRESLKFWKEYIELYNRIKDVVEEHGRERVVKHKLHSFLLNACYDVVQIEAFKGLLHYWKSVKLSAIMKNSDIIRAVNYYELDKKNRTKYKNLFTHKVIIYALIMSLNGVRYKKIRYLEKE